MPSAKALTAEAGAAGQAAGLPRFVRLVRSVLPRLVNRRRQMMRLQDVMTREVKTVSPETDAGEAWAVMKARGIHHLVVSKGRTIVGILSDRDAGGRLGAQVRKGHVVADLMTEPALTVPPETTVRKAANLMRGRSIGCLVVADGSRVLGIVTVSDLLELIGRGLDRHVEATTRWTIKHRAPHRRGRTAATGVW